MKRLWYTYNKGIYMKGLIKKASAIILLGSLFMPSLNVFADEQNFYHWLDDNDMVVDSEDKADYISRLGLNGLSEGAVFLNAFTESGELVETPIDFTSGSAYVGSTYAEFYKIDKNPEYLSKIRLIADNFMNQKTVTGPFVYDQNVTLTLFCPQMKMRNDTGLWSCDMDYQEIYPSDNLHGAKFLLDAYELTNNEDYKTRALEVIDSWHFIQNQFRGAHDGKVAGALPFILYREHNTDPFRMAWSAPNDVAYAVYESTSKALEITGDNKYQQFQDDFFNYLINLFSNVETSTFSFERDGESYKLPFEYMIVDDNLVFKGVNQSNQDGSFTTTNDITSDQLFYTLLGLFKYNKDLPICQEFYKTLKVLELPNGGFYGEYSIAGEKGSHDVSIELINTGMYLDVLNIFGAPESEKEVVVRYLRDTQLQTSNRNTAGSWRWNDAEGISGGINETLATAVILRALRPYVNDDGSTIYDEVQETTNKATPSEQQETDANKINPETYDNVALHATAIVLLGAAILAIRKR